MGQRLLIDKSLGFPSSPVYQLGFWGFSLIWVFTAPPSTVAQYALLGFSYYKIEE
jgi:hypothetical protein